ncbi:hypothetical protein [Hyalangium rubrum]|uniref:Uncharacterized protein n=1 Tax=Hyalangium rubrum TaxID=3103134 RepID=A0ABU5GZ76_9BACT|nr:hypothetical protein [Hyalangium sp. s54d21]MDY7226004.1 hypothetical protein [Hyalangium sp. s54d21]
MYEPTDNPGGGGPPRGGDGNAPKPNAARPRPWSVVRGTPTPIPLAPEELPVQNEVVPAPAEPIPNELLHLWTLLTQREKWSSLVVVPAQPGASGLDAGRAIVTVGSQYRERPIRLIDAQGLPPGAGSRLVRDIRGIVEQGGMVVTCIDSVITNPVGLEVALAAERALLCVPLGSTQFSAAKHTLEMIGKARFLGSVTLQQRVGSKK